MVSDSSALPAFPQFKIDLDLAPEERFKESTAYFKEPIFTVIDLYLQYIPDAIIDMFALLEPVDAFKQKEHYKEMQGIQEVLEIDMDEVMLLNYLYELQAFCTSIVARQADGTIIHGRNLDFSFSDEMRNITYIGNYYKDGVHLFDAVMFAADIGIYTGVRPGAFSISENDRQGKVTIDAILANIKMMFEGQDEISWITRQALTNCNNFECALNHFVSAPIIATGYLTMAGIKPYEGAIISRDKFGAAHIDMLSNKTWYLAQTNDDHFDGTCQNRC